MKSHLKNARISPKKLNLVAGMVRGEKTHEALNQLKFTPKKGAKILHKLITSAVANATNNFEQNEENLYVKSIMVTKGVTYKRGLPVSRGRYHPVLKRNTNIVVEVGMIDPTLGKTKKSAKTPEKTESSEVAEKPKAKKTVEAAAEKPKKKTVAKKSTKKTPENA